MNALAKRIVKLSRALGTDVKPIVPVIAHLNESPNDALIRHGYDPEDTSVRYMVMTPVAATKRVGDEC